MTSKPTLWHLKISHYSEKVRWALDYKSVEHERRSPMPGYHMLVSLALTKGRSYTLPVLELDGERFGDSTVIIAAVEERYPEPALYPSQAAERRRALELEDWFDEELGPSMRRLAFNALRADREQFDQLARAQAPPALARFASMPGRYARAFTALRFHAASARAADAARGKVLAALDRLESELGERDYLVGGRFTVADLTAAALFYPLVLPPEGPLRIQTPAGFGELRDSLADRRGYRWVQEMFARHRRHREPSGGALAEAV
jgi:glutathione S-transferase